MSSSHMLNTQDESAIFDTNHCICTPNKRESSCRLHYKTKPCVFQWIKVTQSSHRAHYAQKHSVVTSLTMGEVALLIHADLWCVHQEANGNGPAHGGPHPRVTGAALVHLQQGQITGWCSRQSNHVVIIAVCVTGGMSVRTGQRASKRDTLNVFSGIVNKTYNEPTVYFYTHPHHYKTLLQPHLSRSRIQQCRSHRRTSWRHLQCRSI